VDKENTLTHKGVGEGACHLRERPPLAVLKVAQGVVVPSFSAVGCLEEEEEEEAAAGPFLSLLLQLQQRQHYSYCLPPWYSSPGVAVLLAVSMVSNTSIPSSSASVSSL
jgi:hypothetical protein